MAGIVASERTYPLAASGKITVRTPDGIESTKDLSGATQTIDEWITELNSLFATMELQFEKISDTRIGASVFEDWDYKKLEISGTGAEALGFDSGKTWQEGFFGETDPVKAAGFELY
jgi:hypothetical protein